MKASIFYLLLMNPFAKSFILTCEIDVIGRSTTVEVI
jgi:hypothetical protein